VSTAVDPNAFDSSPVLAGAFTDVIQKLAAAGESLEQIASEFGLTAEQVSAVVFDGADLNDINSGAGSAPISSGGISTMGIYIGGGVLLVAGLVAWLYFGSGVWGAVLIGTAVLVGGVGIYLGT
jgi:hypothetical protein